MRGVAGILRIPVAARATPETIKKVLLFNLKSIV
jgi:hypothetical protein